MGSCARPWVLDPWVMGSCARPWALDPWVMGSCARPWAFKALKTVNHRSDKLSL